MKQTTQEETMHKRKNEKAVSQIETKSFLVIVVLLSLMIILSGILSYIIPQGE